MRSIRDRARRCAAIVFVAIIAAVPSTTASAQCPFNPDGYFVIAGDPPAGFESVAYVSLWAYGPRPDTRHPTGIYLTNGEGYAVQRIDIATGPGGLGWRWNFTTVELTGTHYEFEGAFLDVCYFADPDIGKPGRIMLQGHLVKVERAVRVAEADVKFTYTAKLPKRRKSAKA